MIIDGDINIRRTKSKETSGPPYSGAASGLGVKAGAGNDTGAGKVTLIFVSDTCREL